MNVFFIKREVYFVIFIKKIKEIVSMVVLERVKMYCKFGEWLSYGYWGILVIEEGKED